MREYSRSEKYMLLTKVLFMVLLSGCMFFYLFYSLTDHSTGYAHREPIKLEDWTVVTDTMSYKVKDPHQEEPAFGEHFWIRTQLPEDIDEEMDLLFLYFSDTQVKIGGEVRKDFVAARDVRLPGGPVKATYMLVTVSPEDAGKTLEIARIRSNTERRIYPTTILGPSEDVYQYLMEVYGGVFVMYLVLLAVSVLVIVGGIILRIWLKSPIGMMYAGFAVLITTAWMVSDSYLYPFVFGHFYIDGTISYLLCMLIPMPFFIYMDTLQKKRYEKAYLILLIVSIVNFFVWTILHFTGVFPFDRALQLIDAVIVIDIVACLVITIKDIIHGHVKEYKYTAIGFLGFLFLSLMQIVVILTMDLKNDGVLLLLGLLFLLICVVLQQLRELRTADMEKKRAMELSDAKTRFLASMSHEIRTPINSILGMNEMILRENQDVVINEYAKNVQSAGKMLLALINDVLDFSKIEAGKLEISPAEYNLSGLLFEIASLAKERSNAKSLDFFLNIAGNIPSILYSDEVRIKQILINLLSNAVKYTDHGSVTLAVSGECVSDEIYRLRFDVTDTGKGIREEEQGRLFDAFTRADLARNRSVEGTGLGLAIVKSIVDSMQGEISVQSVYGSGSTFSVTLPQEVKDWTPVDTNLEEAGQRSAGKAYQPGFRAPDARILAVDDNAANLSIVRQFLKATGVGLDCCLSGAEALQKCLENKYDLILLDHMMPDPDGLVTLARIKNSDLSKNRNTNAVVLTANAVAGSRKLYLDAGFVDYLTKPINSHLLEETVEKYLPKELILHDAVPEETVSSGEAPKQNEAKSKWDQIEEIDYRMAIDYCGDEEVFRIVADEIVKDCKPRTKRMQEALAAGDFDAYRIEAHAIKSNLATLGAAAFSERARQHEYAVKENRLDFIKADQEAFIAAYLELCEKLERTLRE